MNILHQNNAYTLAVTYGLCPEPDLKYEPWWTKGTTFCYSFASKHRGHKLLVKFDERELEPTAW